MSMPAVSPSTPPPQPPAHTSIGPITAPVRPEIHPIPAQIHRQSTKLSQRLSSGTPTHGQRAEQGDLANLRDQLTLMSGGTTSTLGPQGSFGIGGSFGPGHSSSGFLGAMSSDSLIASDLHGADPIELLLRKTAALGQSRLAHRGLKRAMTTGGITEHTEENSEGIATPTETEDEGPESAFQVMDEKINFLIDIMFKNLKYTKAIYLSTKKSLNGPGHEIGLGMIGRVSTYGNTSGGTLTQRGSPRSSMKSEKAGVLTKSATRETIGRGSENAQKVSNMLELTRYIMRQKEKKSRHTEIGAKMWRFMEDKSSSRKAAAYSFLNHFLLAASVVAACFDVIDINVGKGDKVNVGRPIAIAIECCFAIELTLRFVFCPQPRLFWLNKYNIIDAASACPLIIRVVTLFSAAWDNSEEVNAILCLVPALRLCKLLRRFETFHLLTSAFKTSIEALPVILFTMMLIGLTFSAIIYYVEPRSNVKNFGLAVWYVMVTMCGVAPGEPTPETNAGKLFTVCLMLCGVLYMAIPIGIVGTAFSGVWAERKRLLLLQRMRDCVERAGYTPDDLRAMFKLLDQDNDGSLDFKEFSSMLDVMQIGVEDEFAMQVFESFDADCEGSIDFHELLRGLFPQSARSYMEQYLAAARDCRMSEDPPLEPMPKTTRYSLQGSYISHRYSSDAVARSTWQSSNVWDGRSIGRNSADIQSIPSAHSKKISDQGFHGNRGRHLSSSCSTTSPAPRQLQLGSVNTVPPPADQHLQSSGSFPKEPTSPIQSRQRALAHMRGKSAEAIL